MNPFALLEVFTATSRLAKRFMAVPGNKHILLKSSIFLCVFDLRWAATQLRYISQGQLFVSVEIGLVLFFFFQKYIKSSNIFLLW